jgi:hypothetical protein
VEKTGCKNVIKDNITRSDLRGINDCVWEIEDRENSGLAGGWPLLWPVT